MCRIRPISPLRSCRQRALEQRVIAVVETFDEMASGGARRCNHLCGILRVAGEWLLHQHMFAAGERGRAPLQMCRRRQRNVDQVDVVAGDELGITTEGQGNRVLFGEVFGAFEIARSDGDDFRAEQRIGRSHDAAWRDPCRAQYSNAYHGASLA